MGKVIFLIILLATLTGCNSDMCGNEISKTELSPDGMSKAVVFNRDCGATTGSSTQISIIKSGEKLPNDDGNILVIKYKENFVLKWLSNNQLEIKGNLSSKTFKKVEKFKNVSVIYVQSKL